MLGCVLTACSAAHSVSTRTNAACDGGEPGACECSDRATGKRACGATSSPSDEDAGSTPAVSAADSGRSQDGASAPQSTEPATQTPEAPSDAPNTDAKPEAPATAEPEVSAPPPPAAGPEVVVEPNDDAAYLFDQATVRTYDIQLDPDDLAKIDDNPGAEAIVPGSLVFEGQTYGPLGVRYKGSIGAFHPPCLAGGMGSPRDGKCSIKLDFNELDSEGRFFGLKKLNLHSMNNDASLLRDRLGYTMFREMRVAAPRAAHARVLINGELQGLFIAVEQVDGRFTRARFAEGGDGNVYKEVWPMYTDAQPYRAALETNAELDNVQRMLDFKAAIDIGPEATAEWVDLDYTTRYLAVDRVIINDDGIMHFWCNQVSQGNNLGPFGNHNFYWYEAAAQNRFWLIPWDLDHSFDSEPVVHVHPEWNSTGSECLCQDTGDFGYQYPAACETLIQRFIAWDTQFQAQTDAFLDGPFTKDHVDALLTKWRTQIQPFVVEANGVNRSLSEADWATGVIELERKITMARENRGYPY